MIGGSLIEGALRQSRIVIVCAISGVVVLAWAYLLLGAGMSMHEMGEMPMAREPALWTPAYFAVVMTMWAVMMAAMMLPSAAPMILLYDKIARHRVPDGDYALVVGLFGLGYVLVWGAFSLMAVVLQFGLDQATLLSPMMSTTSTWLAGAVLIAAGLYQWTPLKQTCLRRCRSPLEFLITEWRDGGKGALLIGFRHGAYCLGCCWALMLLLFVGGIMNLVWIAAIAVFIAVEKLAPAGHWIGKGAGVVMATWGAITIGWTMISLSA